MSISEVISSAQTLIEDAERLEIRKAETIAFLREQRATIDKDLAALGADKPEPAKKRKPGRPRKALGDNARLSRKGGEPQIPTEG